MPAAKESFKSIVITQAIAIVGFIVVPAVVTFVAPRTTIEMRRSGDHASAKITKYILLVVPCREVTIEPMAGVEEHVTADKYGYSTYSDRRRDRKVHTMGTGSIWIIGRDSKYQVESTPTDAPLQAAQIKAFLDNPAAEPLAMTVTVGWMLTYLLGGVMTGLSGLYCVGATLAVGRWLLRLALPRRDPHTRE